jgi:regulatory protein YycI of two-component signal transduction system YycFG
MNKSTFKDILVESLALQQIDLSDDSSSALLNQIKQSVRDACHQLNIDLKTFFNSLVKA